MARQQPHLGELTLPARLGDSTNVRWHDASTPSHRKRPNCCKLWRSPQTAYGSKPIFRLFFSTSERRSACFLQWHPDVADPRHRPPMGNHGTECYLSKCPERSAGKHQTSATMETGMRYQADIGTLRLRQCRQFSRPGRLPAPAYRRCHLPATRQMRPPCVQLWIDITRQSLFECVRALALHTEVFSPDTQWRASQF